MKKKHDILILNRAYIPVHIVAWQEGIGLVYKSAGRALDRDYVSYEFEDWVKYTEANMLAEYAIIKTARGPIAVPEIVVLTRYNRLPNRNVKYSRENIFRRDKYTCAYCRFIFPYRDLTIDHIMPKAKGGTSIWSNVVTACKPCNNKKADRTPDQAGMHLHTKPTKPNWISPLSHVAAQDHPCKSWLHFSDRVDTIKTKVEDVPDDPNLVEKE